jgi:hypothetical protein
MTAAIANWRARFNVAFIFQQNAKLRRGAKG